MRKFFALFRYEFYKAGLTVLIILFLYFLALMAAFLYVLTHY